MNVGFVRTDGSCVGLMLCLLFGRKSGRELCSVVGLRFELDFFFCYGVGGMSQKRRITIYNSITVSNLLEQKKTNQKVNL